jgi:uncharacterized protein
MAERGRLKQMQMAFAAHIRDPAHSPAPDGIEDRRMAIYRELFFNNVRDLLGQTFPVTRRIVGEAHWRAMVRDWFRQHRARTPLFLELPREFLDYLGQEREAAPEDPPFLLELAHYEWVELALSIDEREAGLQGVDPAGDLLDGRPVVSPLAWPLVYAWPVHRISPSFRPTKPPADPTRLLVWRDRGDRVSFMEINLVTARLLELLDADVAAGLSGRRCLEQIAAELGRPDPAPVIGAGARALEDLRARHVVLGSRPVAG